MRPGFDTGQVPVNVPIREHGFDNSTETTLPRRDDPVWVWPRHPKRFLVLRVVIASPRFASEKSKAAKCTAFIK